MKLLWCSDCHSVVQITNKVWRKCDCGKIGGQYNADDVTATIGGIKTTSGSNGELRASGVFGIANWFFLNSFAAKSAKDKMEYRYKWAPEGDGSDCWWGSYAGDQQLFFIELPDGPRLIVTSKLTVMKDKVKVEISNDGRDWYIDGKKNKKSVTIPRATGTFLTTTNQRIGVDIP